VKRFVLQLMTVLLLSTACTSTAPGTDPSRPWQVLKTGSITRPAGELPEEGLHLFQSLSELQVFTERYQIDVPTAAVDFSSHTVAVVVLGWSELQPVVKQIHALKSEPLQAAIILSYDQTKPLPQPALPAGLQVRQFVAMQLFKVAAADVQAE